MFRGVNAINMDAKGRMALPSKYREPVQNLSEGRLVATIDPEERCLLLYPLTIWEDIEKKLQDLPSFDSKARRIQRLLIGHATDIELDGNGRMLIPGPLRHYATLEKHIVLIGQGKKFEVWDEQSWEAKREEWLAESLTDDEQMPDVLGSISL